MSDFDKRLNDEADKFGRHPMATTLRWVAALLVIVAVGIAGVGFITTGSVFFEADRAKLVAGAEVTKKIYDPNNIVAQVNFFTQTCEDVHKDYANWKANQSEFERLQQLTKTARTQGEAAEAESQASQASTYVAGALEQLQGDAHDYNAKSINYTANPFKSAGLPYRIEPPSDSASLNQWVLPSCG